MNDYERRQAEELAAQKYPNQGKPGERALARRAYIEGYGDALDSVAPTEEDYDQDPDFPRLLEEARRAKPEPQHGQSGYATGNGFGHG